MNSTVLRAGARPKIFYGWWIVTTSAILSFFAGGTFVYGFGAFFNPIIREFGWTRAATSLAFSLQRLEGGVMAPVVGFLVDKIGPRWMVMGGFCTAALGFFLLSHVQTLWGFYLTFLIAAAGFSMATFMVTTTAVANWFVRLRGRALAVMYTGYGASGILVAPLIMFIATYGWRQTLAGIAVLYLVLAFTVSWVFYRRPEERGLLPDGDGPQALAAGVGGQSGGRFLRVEDNDMSVKEAIRTPAFWLLAAASNLTFLVSSALFVHEIPALVSFGFTNTTAGLVLTGMTLLSLIGRWGFGSLADFIPKKYVLAMTIVLQATGGLLFAYISQPWHVIPFLIIFAPGYGGSIPVRPALQGDLFGRKSFGSISGALQLVGMVGGIVGPWLAGWTFDIAGSYRPAFVILAVANLVALPLTLLLQQPRRRAPYTVSLR